MDGEQGDILSYGEERLEPVFTIVNLTEIPMAMSALESAGIPCFVENELGAAIYRGGAGRARIFVPSSRREEAVAILEDIYGASPPTETPSQSGPPGRLAVIVRAVRPYFLAAVFFVMGFTAFVSAFLIVSCSTKYYRERAPKIAEARKLGITYDDVVAKPSDYEGKPVYWRLKPHVDAWYYEGDWTKPAVFSEGRPPFRTNYPRDFLARVEGRDSKGRVLLREIE